MIAGIAAIAAFIAGAVVLVLSGFGLVHARRTSPATEILSGHPAHTPAPGTSPVRVNGQQPSDAGLAAAAPATAGTGPA